MSDSSQTTTDLSGLNDRQREAVISEDKRLLVLAGAGSGKTKTLLQKLIYLIEEKGVNPSQILAITFTKNATNEMIDRLIISAEKTKEYEAILFNKYTSKADKDAARLAFTKKYKWVDNLTVKTFHSLCFSVLRNYGVNEFDNRFKIIFDEKIPRYNISFRLIVIIVTYKKLNCIIRKERFELRVKLCSKCFIV